MPRRVSHIAQSTAPKSKNIFAFSKNKSKMIGKWVFDGLKSQGVEIKVLPSGPGYRVWLASPIPLWDDPNWTMENFDTKRKWVWFGSWSYFIWRVCVTGGSEDEYGEVEPFKVIPERIEWLEANKWNVTITRQPTGYSYTIIVKDDDHITPIGIWKGPTKVLAWALAVSDGIHATRGNLARDVSRFQWLTSDLQIQKRICRRLQKAPQT